MTETAPDAQTRVVARSLVGIVANPASGKDIRRLIAHGSAFDNNEKTNIVRRALVGLDAVGVERVAFMPDTHGIVPRAAAPLTLRLDLVPLPMPLLGSAADTLAAAQRLADLGAGAIITLGGDGTNRLVAKGCGEVPLVPISTGTNNVFPRLVEGTIAGLAAGLVATGIARNRPGHPPVVRRRPCLDLLVDGKVSDMALIDVATTRQGTVGARAIWDPSIISEVVLSRITPAEIGMASLGALLFPDACGGCSGAHVVVDHAGGATQRVLAPLAPGLIHAVPIESATVVAPGTIVPLRHGAGTVALDGEREFEPRQRDGPLAVRLNPIGPRVVDIEACLRSAANAGVFVERLDSTLATAQPPTGR